jgi:tripartite-type tricarboxylate transporter receptor subunit TctC
MNRDTKENPMRFWFTILAVLCVLPNASVLAQSDYPTRPVTIVVPYTAGGGVDTVTRIIAPLLAKRLGQAVLIDNRPGVSGMVGSQLVARAKPDGYTLLAGNTTTNVSNLFVYKTLPYDPRKDFEPITMVDSGPCVLVVAADSRFNSVQDIIAELKAHPDALTYGTSGNGSFHHMSASLFQSMTHTKMRQIAYKGSPNVMTDLMGGRIDMAFEVIPVAEPLIKAGRLKALAVTSKHEMAALPGVRPVADLGIPGFEMVAWKGIFAPAGTPEAIAQKLGKEISEIVRMPEVSKRLEALGVNADGRHNADFGKVVQADIAYWGPILHGAGVVPE